MRQLTRDQILQLATPNSLSDLVAMVTVHAVLTRLHDDEPTVVHDGEVTLGLQFSRYHDRRKLKASEPARLAIMSVLDVEWGEYSPNDIHTDGSCLIADYQMRLFREDGQGPEKGAHEARAAAQAQEILRTVGAFFGGMGVETVVIGDHMLDTHAGEPNRATCAHPPLCPFGTCGTMLCLTCGTFYSTCHHAVDGAEEDVLVECYYCDALVWVPVSRVDEPAFCPDHTGDPSEPGNPANPRSHYDVVDNDDGNEAVLAGVQAPTATFVRTMHTIVTQAFQQYRLTDLEAGPLAAFIDLPSLVQQARDLPLDQLAHACQTIEVRHTLGRLLVDTMLAELDADIDWAGSLDVASATADTADSAQWLIQRTRYV